MPDGYGLPVPAMVQARREGGAWSCSTTFEADANAVLAGFAPRPNVRLDYRRVNPEPLYDSPAGATMDLAWSPSICSSSSVNSFAQVYVSPRRRTSASAVLGGRTYRHDGQVRIAYNEAFAGDLVRRRMPPLGYDSRADILHGGDLRSRRSGAGILFLTQDPRVARRAWDAFGDQAHRSSYITGDAMLDPVSAGERWLAYDVIGSYALEPPRRTTRSSA